MSQNSSNRTNRTNITGTPKASGVKTSGIKAAGAKANGTTNTTATNTTATNTTATNTTSTTNSTISTNTTTGVEPSKPIEVSTEITKTGIADNPAILTTELFGQNRVEILESEDFRLDTEHQIDLKKKDCYIILFHTNNEESKNLAIIWNSVAQQVPGPSFAAVNLLSEKKIAQAFVNLNTSNSTYRSFELKGIPFILVYQNGSPVGFYNGERAVQPISDYALTLACKASYFEPLQLTAGIYADNNIAMSGWTEYEGTRKTSVDYITGSSIRQYDATKKPVIVGSEAFTEEGKQVTSDEQQRGIGQTLSGQGIENTSQSTPEEQRSAQTEGVSTGGTTTTNTSTIGEQPVSPR